MVRATADLDPSEKRTPTEEIYQQLGKILCAGRDLTGSDACDDAGHDFAIQKMRDKEVENALAGKLPPNVRTRFVVDILTGSSAGGINAVALAKALALKLPNLRELRDAWENRADLSKLLNKAPRAEETGLSVKTESLLDGGKMYRLAYDVLDKMSQEKDDKGEPRRTKTAGDAGFADEIDLFVTATDLNGLYSPIRLADKYLEERTHKTVFRFRYKDPSVVKQLRAADR